MGVQRGQVHVEAVARTEKAGSLRAEECRASAADASLGGWLQKTQSGETTESGAKTLSPMAVSDSLCRMAEGAPSVQKRVNSKLTGADDVAGADEAAGAGEAAGADEAAGAGEAEAADDARRLQMTPRRRARMTP